MTDSHDSAPESASQPGRSPGTLLVVGGLLIALGVGFVVFGRFIDDFGRSLAFQAAWFGLIALTALALARRWPVLRRALGATLASCALAGAFVFYWTTVRDERVTESVATGVRASEVQATPTTATPTPAPAPKVNVEVASGTFSSLAHETSGKVAIIDLAAGGRRLTVTNLATDNGPDLLVYLVPGPSNPDGGVKGGVSLGRLKGNLGDQQYKVPAGVTLKDGASVVIWCRAFTVAFGVAQLQPS